MSYLFSLKDTRKLIKFEILKPSAKSRVFCKLIRDMKSEIWKLRGQDFLEQGKEFSDKNLLCWNFFFNDVTACSLCFLQIYVLLKDSAKANNVVLSFWH